MAFSPDGTRAYVTNEGVSSTVSVINTATNTVTGTIPVGDGPVGVAFSPVTGATRAYVANYHANTVSVINTATNTVINTVNVGTHPVGLAVSPGTGTRAYVTNRVANTVSVINTEPGTPGYNTAIRDPIRVGRDPMMVAVGPDGTVYVANQSENFVSIIDTSGPTPMVKSIAVGLVPDGAAINPRAEPHATTFRNLAVIDTHTPTPPPSSPTPTSANTRSRWRSAPNSSLAYVANFYSGDVWVIGTTHTNTLIGGHPSWLAPTRRAGRQPRRQRLRHPLQRQPWSPSSPSSRPGLSPRPFAGRPEPRA